MFIILAFAVIAAVITFISYVDNAENASFAAVMSCIVGTVLTIFILAVSYTSYLDIRAQYDAVITQYKGAVTMYADYASLDMEKATFTDFKYQGYQENVAKVIIDLRKEIVGYNKMLIKKNLLNKNPIFSWLIIAPDEDMKIINIVE